MPFHAAQAFVKAASIGLESRKGELPAGLVIEALRLDPENAESRELFKTLAGRGLTGTQQEQDLLELAEEIDRGGQYEQALALLSLLKGTSVQEAANEKVDQINRHSGLDDTEQDGRVAKTSEVSRFAGTKVLVIDDEPEIVLLLEQILDSEGFTVFTARDGQEGLDTYLKERPPLVVSDAMLPKLHGFELCARIKEESDYTAKVMILTAVYKKYKYKGKVQAEYHVDEYLDKPFQITEFLQVFRRMAEGAVEYREEAGEETASQNDLAAPGSGVEGSAESLTILLGTGADVELAARVTAFSERNLFKPVVTHDSASFFDHLKVDDPDIVFISDDMTGIDPFVASHIIRSCMVMDHTTLVLVARDRSRLDEAQHEFDHRIAAPVDRKVLDTIVNLHRSARIKAQVEPVEPEELDEDRVDSLVRSKVARILKSHNQLEEYYSAKVRELEEEIRQLKESRVPEPVEHPEEEPVEHPEPEELEGDPGQEDVYSEDDTPEPEELSDTSDLSEMPEIHEVPEVPEIPEIEDE